MCLHALLIDDMPELLYKVQKKNLLVSAKKMGAGISCFSTDEPLVDKPPKPSQIECDVKSDRTLSHIELWEHMIREGEVHSDHRRVMNLPWTHPIDDDSVQLCYMLYKGPREGIAYVWERGKHKYYEPGESYRDYRLLERHMDQIRTRPKFDRALKLIKTLMDAHNVRGIS